MGKGREHSQGLRSDSTDGKIGGNSLKITPFAFGTEILRAVTSGGEPWFLAKDVCDILGASNTSEALSRLDIDEKGNIILNDTTGRPHRMLAVNESGLYSLALTSRKPHAKAFKKWITAEVLPAIRKTGGYLLPGVSSNVDALTAAVRELQETVSRMSVSPAPVAPQITSIDPLLLGDSEDSLASLTFRLTHEDKAWMQTEARKHNRNLSWVARQAITKLRSITTTQTN